VPSEDVVSTGMRKVSSTPATFDCDVDTFWEIFLSEDFNKKLYLDELGFKEMEIISQTDDTRRLRAVPKLNMPKPVMKLLGDSFGYEEDGRLDRDKGEWQWKMIPNTLSEKLKTEGVVKVEAVGDGQCRRVDTCTLEAKVFGIGKLIESSTEKEIVDGWKQGNAFMKRYLADRQK
jgi:hypothetical protein